MNPHVGPEFESQKPYGLAALRAVFAQFGAPRSMLDVGCADGYLVNYAVGRGVAAIGVDLHAVENRRLLRMDVTKPFYVTGDLVLCWEVAEHLPASSSDYFTKHLAGAVNERLVFTAAAPRQGGYGHVNEQPAEYWREKIEGNDLRYNGDATERLRARWSEVCGPCWWYPQNVQVFER